MATVASLPAWSCRPRQAKADRRIEDADNVGQESSKQGDDSEDAAVGDSDDESGQESSKPSSDDDQSAEDDSGATRVAPITP